MDNMNVDINCAECAMADNVSSLANNDPEFCHHCCIDEDCDYQHSNYDWE